MRKAYEIRSVDIWITGNGLRILETEHNETGENEKTKQKSAILIVTGIFPPDIGGPASYVPKIATELCKRGWRATVITLSDSLSHDDSFYPFRVIRILRPQSKMKRIPQTVWTIAKYTKTADVIFANGLFLESVIASKLKRKPSVIKIVGDWAWERSVNHGWTKDTIDKFQKNRYPIHIQSIKWLRSIVTRCNYKVITPSHYLRRIVEGWGVNSDRIEVIYNALEPINGVSPMQLPSFAGATVITVARLVTWKGIDRIIKVVSSISDVRLIIVGDGTERTSLENLVTDLGTAERVIFTGQVSKQAVLQYLKASDIFVLNSTYEGLPHIVLEAMAVGVPVIATDVGGTGEVVKHEINGLLIPPRDNEALRSAIYRMLENPDERERFARVGQFTISEHFQWNKLVESTEKYIISAIK